MACLDKNSTDKNYLTPPSHLLLHYFYIRPLLKREKGGVWGRKYLNQVELSDRGH